MALYLYTYIYYLRAEIPISKNERLPAFFQRNKFLPGTKEHRRTALASWIFQSPKHAQRMNERVGEFLLFFQEYSACMAPAGKDLCSALTQGKP